MLFEDPNMDFGYQKQYLKSKEAKSSKVESYSPVLIEL